MGKRAMSSQVSQLSQKINKNNYIPCNKTQLNNLIKFLRPKVYITSSSNFKTLVQQLTGKGSISPTSIHHESVEESEHPTQNFKAMDEVSQDIMNPFENSDIINEGQVYFLTKSRQESINQELSVDSSEGAISSSFIVHEPSIHKSSVTVLDSSIQNTMNPFPNSDTIKKGQVYFLSESHQESINQELSVDSWKGNMLSSFIEHEPSVQKSSVTVLDNAIQDIMYRFENSDTTDEGQVYSLTKSHQESISQELSVDSLEGGTPPSFTTHEPFIQKSPITVLDSFIPCQEMDFSAEYRKMESWLLEIESCSNHHHHQEQISICDNYDSYLSNIL